MTNRREFLATLAAVVVFRQDDTPYLQALIDRGEPIPPGWYDLRTPLDMRGRHVHSEYSSYVIRAAIIGPPASGTFSHNYLRWYPLTRT